jgi:hypothetical protein
LPNKPIFIKIFKENSIEHTLNMFYGLPLFIVPVFGEQVTMLLEYRAFQTVYQAQFGFQSQAIGSTPWRTPAGSQCGTLGRRYPDR